MNMGDVERTDCKLPFIDLTSDNASISRHTDPFIDFAASEDRSASHIPEIDLTDGDNFNLTSSLPVIDLTNDNDQIRNRSIPVIDLTDEDVHYISHQTHIDLTYNDASNCNSRIRNFNFGETDDRKVNSSTKIIDLSHDDIQNINPNKSVIDLTCDNDQFLNCRKQDIDMRDDDILDITHGLQSFDVASGKQKNTDDCIPTNDFTNQNDQSIGAVIPILDLTNDKNCDNDRGPNIDLVQRHYKRPVDDVEMTDLSYYNSTINFQKPIIESRMPNTHPNYNRTKNDSSNMNEMQVGTSSNIHHRKDILESYPIKNTFEERNETILTNHTLRRNTEENYLMPENSKKISQNNAFDFLEQAHQPVPLRHSFGRSTVNTSQNIPIEGIEASEGETVTVSSIIHRKKSKPGTTVSKHNPKKSKNPFASDEKAFSSKCIEGFFQKFWIIFILTFMGIYYWIL